MISEMEDFGTSYYGVFLGFDPQEIDRLIECLQSLKERQIDHFHMFNLFSSDDKGIADIEISLKGENEKDNMQFP